MSIAARRLQRTIVASTVQATYSLWPTNPTPITISDSDNSPVELGAKFSSTVATQVLGVRFYKGAANTGTHSGSLWNTGGTRLATVTFTGETASGWQQMLFSSPVAITANTTYIVSYFAPGGRYSNNVNYFTSTYTNGILSAPSNSTTQNGVYAYSATSTFPNTSGSGTNYWVDVIVAGVSDTIAPTAPTSLQGSANGSLVSLTWTASTDNIGVTGYTIYRDGSPIGTATTTSYTDTTASTSTAYAYTVRARDYNNNFSLASNTASITTTANALPTASFTANPVDRTVYVNASSSSDPDGTIASYAWTFGDGGTATGQTADHLYASDGTYTVSLTVTDNQGGTDTDSRSVIVAVGNFVPNLINNPSLGGYPDATNTGVLTGVPLTSSGSITITTNGAIVENLDVSGYIVVKANNVTIRNVRLTSGDYFPIDYNQGAEVYTGLLIEDLKFIGTNTSVTSLGPHMNYTARRVDVSGGADGFKAESNVTIEDCYIHDLRTTETSHNDGVQTTGGSNVTIRHNTIKLAGINAEIFQLGIEWGPVSNWTIDNNLIDGGGYVFNTNQPTLPGFVITNNRFTRTQGWYVASSPGATYSGNYYDDNGDPVVL